MPHQTRFSFYQTLCAGAGDTVAAMTQREQAVGEGLEADMAMAGGGGDKPGRGGQGAGTSDGDPGDRSNLGDWGDGVDHQTSARLARV